jgi:hypothetical protein
LAIETDPGSTQAISARQLASTSENEPQAKLTLPGQKSPLTKQNEEGQVHTGDAVLKDNFQSLHSK